MHVLSYIETVQCQQQANCKKESLHEVFLDLPIFVDLSTSLDGIFLLRSVNAVSRLSLLCCGSSNIDL